jgi:hypothetical protein
MIAVLSVINIKDQRMANTGSETLFCLSKPLLETGTCSQKAFGYVSDLCQAKDPDKALENRPTNPRILA